MRTPAPHTIDVSGVSFLEIGRGSDVSVGPDLSALVLAPSIAGALGAKRTFYSLDNERERILNSPPRVDDGLWLLQGYLDERTTITLDADGGITTAFFNLSGLGGIEAAPAVGDFDYLEYPLGPEAQPDAPKSWGGVSG